MLNYRQESSADGNGVDGNDNDGNDVFAMLEC